MMDLNSQPPFPDEAYSGHIETFDTLQAYAYYTGNFVAYRTALFEEDIESLKGWYTSTILDVYTQYLTEEVVERAGPSAPNIHILKTSHGNLIKNYERARIRDLAGNYEFERYDYVIVPLNDARADAKADGGSHWSLLVVNMRKRESTHFDCLPRKHEFGTGHANRESAISFLHNLGALVDAERGVWTILENLTCPKDNTKSACGAITCWVMEKVLQILYARAALPDSEVVPGQALKESGFDDKGMRRRVMQKIARNAKGFAIFMQFFGEGTMEAMATELKESSREVQTREAQDAEKAGVSHELGETTELEKALISRES